MLDELTGTVIDAPGRTAISPGRWSPLGATAGPAGVNFAVRAEPATAVELLLFDSPTDPAPSRTVPLTDATGDVRHVHVGGARPGLGYAYRILGDGGTGGTVRLDPYAHAVETRRRDPVGVVVDLAGYDWADEARPDHPLADSVLYELPVGGFTRGPDAGVRAPGTFRGLAEKIPYLTRLGVTAVVLLRAVHPDRSAPAAPDAATCTDPARAVEEFRDLVRALHGAGIEVILDLAPEPVAPVDPAARKLVLDGLTFWARDLHVDGFRFARGPAPDGVLLLADDLLGVKLLTGPPAPGTAAYFPAHRWAGRNEDFRDAVRAFVAGTPGILRRVATELGRTGVNDVTAPGPTAEGPADDPRARARRCREVKNLAALLLLAAGVPVLSAGDEVRRTRGGDDGDLDPDDPAGWFDWQGPLRHPDQLRFVQRMAGFRRSRPVLRNSAPRRWHGTRLDDPGWEDPVGRALACTAGEGPDAVHVIANMAPEVLAFELPPVDGGGWRRVADTGLPGSLDVADPGGEVPIAGGEYLANPYTVIVLVRGPAA